MSEARMNGIETLLRTYSIVSGRENNWLPGVIMNGEIENMHLNPHKLEQFLDRFSKEKAFPDVVLEAISAKNVNKDSIIKNIGISEYILEKLLTNTVLPNVIPLRKMISLLNFLHIPLLRAVDSFRVSLNRFNVEKSLETANGVSMRRKPITPFNSGAGKVSKEALKRSLEVYIKRLFEEAR